jgi:hypothetical protein
MVVAAIIGEATKADIDHPIREGQCWALQVYPWWSHFRHIDRALDNDLACVHIDTHQYMTGASDLSNCKD